MICKFSEYKLKQECSSYEGWPNLVSLSFAIYNSTVDRSRIAIRVFGRMVIRVAKMGRNSLFNVCTVLVKQIAETKIAITSQLCAHLLASEGQRSCTPVKKSGGRHLKSVNGTLMNSANNDEWFKV
jgi:hypothetical protein